MTESKAIEVPFSDDAAEEVSDDQLLFEADKPGLTEEQKQLRAQRRRDRQKERDAQAKAKDEELATLRGEMIQLRGQLQGVAAAARQPAHADDGKDPFDRQLDGIYAEQSTVYENYMAEAHAAASRKEKLPAEREAYYAQQSRNFEGRKMRVETARALAVEANRTRGETARQIWVQKYPEVYGNNDALAYATATFERKKALRENITNDTIDEIMNETRVQFKLGGKPAPSNTERARMSGISANGGNGGGGAPTGGIPMTKELRAMAIAKYSHLPEKDAIKAWVDREGKALRADKVL